ncbi:unnamed protein product [Vitrella brassicaformis CCMP3155]|uniref:Uncharacterized protein n=1 Tax=Vitrella brassicaformis (strain CCMP3155) TaxID=1169540 RepID=A0A0G4F0S9_VITBC|nr:unnamed protein product [Vitrella brassicaformis CCMP3155]|eukprot:CEM04672.1 unnamed protein product [Vitrella brassicaformis CCMP3155]
MRVRRSRLAVDQTASDEDLQSQESDLSADLADMKDNMNLRQQHSRLLEHIAHDTKQLIDASQQMGELAVTADEKALSKRWVKKERSLLALGTSLLHESKQDAMRLTAGLKTQLEDAINTERSLIAQADELNHHLQQGEEAQPVAQQTDNTASKGQEQVAEGGAASKDSPQAA